MTKEYSLSGSWPINTRILMLQPSTEKAQRLWFRAVGGRGDTFSQLLGAPGGRDSWFILAYPCSNSVE